MKFKRAPKKVDIFESPRQNKRYMAIFYDDNSYLPVKTVHFGSPFFENYTMHGDEKRKIHYINRHGVNQDWTDPYNAGTLSRYLLWNKPTIQESFEDYLNLFDLEAVE